MKQWAIIGQSGAIVNIVTSVRPPLEYGRLVLGEVLPLEKVSRDKLERYEYWSTRP